MSRGKGARVQSQREAARSARSRAKPSREIAKSADPLLKLQQDAGNRAVDGLLRSGAGGHSIDPETRADMEQRFGADFGSVRVHTDADAWRAATLLNAKAFTVGDAIGFGEGRYAPRTREGKRLLAHELAHVVQQSRGGAAPHAGTPNAALEQGADAAATQATASAGAVSVAGASGVGVACQGDDERKQDSDPAAIRAQEDMEKFRFRCGSHHSQTDKIDWKLKPGSFDFPQFDWKPEEKKADTPEPNAHTTPSRTGGVDSKTDFFKLKKPTDISPELLAFLDGEAKEKKKPPPLKVVPSESMYLDPYLDRPTAERKLREEHALHEKMFPGLDEKILGNDPYYWRAMGTYRPTAHPPTDAAVPPADPNVPAPLVFWQDPTMHIRIPDIVHDNPDYWKTPRGKFRRKLADDIRALRNLYESLAGQRNDVVGGSTVIRKVGENMAGDIDPPPVRDLRHAYELLDQANKAIAKDDLEGAQQKYVEAKELKDKVSWEWGHYSDFLEYGLNREVESLEDVRDASKYTLMGLSMGGGAAAMWAGTLGLMAIDATDAAGKAALGEKVNWKELGVNMVVQILLTRFGGNITRGLLGRLANLPGMRGVEQSVIAEALTNGAVARAVTQVVDKEFNGRDLTWDEIVEHVFDPRYAAYDVVLGLVTKQMQRTPSGEEPAELSPTPASKKSPPPRLKPAATKALPPKQVNEPGESAGGQDATQERSDTPPPIPLSRGKTPRGPSTKLKGPPGETPAISWKRPRKPAPIEPDPIAPEQAIPQEQPLRKAAGGYEDVVQPGQENSGDRVVGSNASGKGSPGIGGVPGERRKLTALPGGRARNAPPPRGGKRSASVVRAAEPESDLDTTIVDEPPALSERELAQMNKSQRRRYVKENFPSATDLSWTRTPETVKLNREGTLVVRSEPGMLTNDVRRKASALGSVASDGGLTKQGRLPARVKVKNTYDPEGPPVALSRAHRNKLIDQTHTQAEAGNWDEQRKFGAIRRILIMEGDHVIDLQLGGADDLNNIWVLDAYTNERLGAQIREQLRNMPVGTRVKKVQGPR